MIILKEVFRLNSIASFIVKHKRFMLIFYTLLIVSSIIGSRFVDVNYDLSSYLPNELNSIKGREILSKDFGIKGTAYVLVKDIPLKEISTLVEDIERISGVKSVIWLGSGEDILKPIEFMDEMVKVEFLREKANLIQVYFHNQDDTAETIKALEEIKSLVGNRALVGGSAAVSRDIRKITDKEVLYYSIVAFVIISIILFLSMDSFIEPILFFLTIGVAIVLNMGTNSLFPNVSYMTHSIAAILQLAVSMDYSIFLLHRFMVEKIVHENKEDAMIEAIKKTFVSILASSLTTVGGFVALVTMKYGIGKDMGLVLAKGVLFSLITVVTLLPILILLFDEKIEKYKHRIFFPNFKKTAPIIIKYRFVFLALALILTLPAFLAQSKVEYYYANEKVIPATSDSIVANKEIDKLFQNKNQLALIIPKGEKLKELELLEELKALDGVKNVRGLYSLVDTSLPEDFLPKEVKENFLTDRYSMINIVLNAPLEGDTTQTILDEIETLVSKEYPENFLTGEAAIYSDLKEVTSKDFSKVTIISVILIGGVILLAFKSIAIPLILVFIIQLGIWINLAIPYLLGNELNFISFIIIGAIQLGATVDYAILYTSRFKENLETLPEIEAAQATIKDTGASILTSSLILFTGTLSVSLITSIKNAAELTMLIGRGAIISLILVLAVLPSILILLNKFVAFTTLGWPKDNIKGRS